MLRGMGVLEFKDNVNQYDQIICFGAGKRLEVLGYYFKGTDVLDKITYIADNDINKRGTKAFIYERSYTIISFQDLRNFLESDILNNKTALLITCVKYEEIANQLLQDSATKDCDILALTYMERTIEEDKAMQKKIPSNLRLTDSPVIPKVIHYCWFGGNPIPDKNKKWMESWHKFCPDYKVIEWNESNYDVTKNQYMYQAYQRKKWGFVSDYARLDIVYQYGGIYLDIDVELVKNWDHLLHQEGFAGFESESYVNTGLGFGARAGLSIVKEMRDDYEDMSFTDEYGNINALACPILQTKVLQKKGLVTNGEYQIVEGMTIYPEKMFSGKSYSTMRVRLAPYTCSIHHYDASWVDNIEQLNRAKCLQEEMSRFEL